MDESIRLHKEILEARPVIGLEQCSFLKFMHFQLGAYVSMKGLEQGPEDLINKMHTQAAFSNTPRIGITDNVCYPAFQLNITPAV
jgi:hypothetical protein